MSQKQSSALIRTYGMGLYILLAGCVLSAAGCDPGIETLLLVSVEGKPANTSELLATTIVTPPMGKPQEDSQVHSFPGSVDRFGLRFPANTTGSLSMLVATKRNGCLSWQKLESLLLNGEPQIDITTKLVQTIFDTCPTQPLSLSSVWGSGEDDVWMVGSGGYIGRWNGTKIETIDLRVTTGFNTVWGLSANHVWIGGSSGRLIHYRSGAWKSLNLSPNYTFLAVHGTSEKDIWAVGHEKSGTETKPLILHIDATNPDNITWSNVMLDPQLRGTQYAVFARRDRVWSVGESGRLLTSGMGSWVSKAGFNAPTSATLYGVFGSPEGKDLLISSQDGTVYRSTDDGDTFSKSVVIKKDNSAAAQWSIWPVSADWAFVGGELGTLSKWDHGTWYSLSPTGFAADFAAFGLWGVVKGGRLKTMWAVGSQDSDGTSVGGVYRYVDEQ